MWEIYLSNKGWIILIEQNNRTYIISIMYCISCVSLNIRRMFDKFLSGITQRYEPSVWIMEGNRPCQSPSTFALFEVSEVGDWKGGISRLDLSTQPWGFDRLIMQIKPRLLEKYTRRRAIPHRFRVSDFCLAIEFRSTSPLLSCVERCLLEFDYQPSLREIKRN